MSSSSQTPARKLRAIAAGAGLALTLGPAFAQSPVAPAPGDPPPLPEVGLWYDDSGKGAVRISQCGDQLCGHIYWLKSPLNSKGEPLHDVNNPDPAQRVRPICGLQVVGRLAAQRDGTWGGGWIYDPKVGKAYNVQIRRASAEVLEVHGYAGVKMFGKTLIWRKAPEDLPACQPELQANSRP